MRNSRMAMVILPAVLLLCLVVAFWGTILDALPIDQSHWLGINNAMYHYGEKGDLDLGWFEEGGNRYYLDPDTGGAMVTGWAEIDGSRYFFSDAGRMTTGWLEREEGRYHLAEDGAADIGWLTLGGQRFYLDEDGLAATGWREIEGTRYCMDEIGAVRTGWYEENGARYYLKQDGAMATGWCSVGEDRHYLDESTGIAISGWLETEEGRYYLDDWGRVFIGWQDIGGSRYYMDAQGLVQTGWLELDGDRYYLTEDGVMVTGWLELDGVRYYLREDGTAAKGKVVIDQQNYYFTSTGANIILVNPWNHLPEDYEVTLVTVSGKKVAAECSKALEQMLADCKAAGNRPMICSAYRSWSGQAYNLNRKISQYQAGGLSYEAAYAKAVKVVAVPGTSEHQLGLAVDIIDAAYQMLNRRQSETATQQWLMEHCWEYGFILRYPDGTTDSTGIIYEPWHYRYVGEELALELRDLEICLEQYLEDLTQE